MKMETEEELQEILAIAKEKLVSRILHEHDHLDGATHSFLILDVKLEINRRILEENQKVSYELEVYDFKDKTIGLYHFYLKDLKQLISENKKFFKYNKVVEYSII